MANLNNMFNSDDSMTFTIILLMIVKYVVMVKGGSMSHEIIQNLMANKFSDFWRDLWLTAVMYVLEGWPS